MTEVSERPIELDYYTLFFPPSTLDVTKKEVRVAVHILKPTKRIRANPHFLIAIALDGGLHLPVNIARSEEEMVLIFDVDSAGTYSVTEKSLFENLRVSELQSLARRFEVEGRSKMVKRELIDALEKATEGLSYPELKKVVDEVSWPS